MKGRGLQGIFGRFLRDRRGATSAVMVLMLVPIIGAVGMAVEGGGWYVVHRAAQNAADSASMAAALNACEPGDDCEDDGANFMEEAAAVAAKFGFTDDDSTDIASSKVNCPGTTEPDCFQVLITKRYPLALVRMVGFNGDATIGSTPAQTIRASAIAAPPEVENLVPCIFGKSETGSAITLSGLGGSPSGGGCILWSNSNMTCNGANAQGYPSQAYAAGGSNNCSADPQTGSDPFEDPFVAAQAHIPSDTCTGATMALKYPQAGTGTDQQITSAWTGSSTTPKRICGNARLSGSSPIEVTEPNSVLVIYNGRLDLNNMTLRTTGNGSLTIIFAATGTPPTGTTYNHAIVFTNGGAVDTLSVRAPNSGDLSGIAIMQDSDATGAGHTVNMNFTGIQPQLNIQGLLYFPNATFSIGGNINYFSNDVHCVSIVANIVNVSGTGAFVDGATDDCLDAGLELPTVPGAADRQALVQ